MYWVAWIGIGIAFEVYGALSSAPTLSEGMQIAWQYDWAKPVLAFGWALLTGHLFFGWWN